MDNYPPGAANDPHAPYNQVENPEITVKIGVWYTVYKEIEVETSDYELEKDESEDGTYINRNFDNTDFYSLIEEELPSPEDWEKVDMDFEVLG